MPDNLRGSRMGTTSLESVRGAVLAEAATHTYICETDHAVQVTFAADAVPPAVWTCPRHGRPAALVVTADTPVAVIVDGTMPTERTVLSTLGSLADDLAAHEVVPPAIIVIGEVVAVARPAHYGRA